MTILKNLGFIYMEMKVVAMGGQARMSCRGVTFKGNMLEIREYIWDICCFLECWTSPLKGYFFYIFLLTEIFLELGFYYFNQAF